MALRSVVSGLSLASHLLLKIMVGHLSAENFGHDGRPEWLGSPVRAKLVQAAETLLARAWASGPLPVMVSARAWLSKAKEISAQWNARGRASRTGVFHWNQYRYAGAPPWAALRSHCVTAPWRTDAAIMR